MVKENKLVILIYILLYQYTNLPPTMFVGYKCLHCNTIMSIIYVYQGRNIHDLVIHLCIEDKMDGLS